jgi:hypothetical protein
MGTTFGGHRLYRPTDPNARLALPSAASTAIAVGDLLWWDSGASPKVLKPMDRYTATANDDTDQADIRSKFAGVALTGKLSTDTSAGYPGFNAEVIQFAAHCYYEATCASGTWELGDLVAASWNSGTGVDKIDNQTVAKTTEANEALGYCVQQYLSNTTTVRCFLIGRFSPFNFADYNTITAA